MKVFASKSNKKFANDLVLAIGGGTTIDKAKIYCKKYNKRCIAIPTTASGATATSHAVIWGKTKEDFKTDIPFTIMWENYPKKLPKKVLEDTFYDCVGHIYESLKSMKATKESRKYAESALFALRVAGHLAGKAIEITGTNIIHKMSYPLTLGGWSHGEAVGFVYRLLCGDCRHSTHRAHKIPRRMFV